MKKNEVFKWCVIGAGPAGIAAVGKLLDNKIPSKEILWIDPYFSVGDLGKKWFNVSSNTQVDLFVKFLEECESFAYNKRNKNFPLDQLPAQEHCLLKEIAAPLQWVTDHLKDTVSSFLGTALNLDQVKEGWQVSTKDHTFIAHKVILATGSEPKQLSHPDLEVIPIDVALNPEKLAKVIQPDDVIGVFGASHSGVLVLENLIHLDVKMVYNFYRSPHLYAVYLSDWILYDNTGLKGRAAKWARKHLDGVHPKNLQRHEIDKGEYESHLANCNKVVYAVGFKSRTVPVIVPYPNARYKETTGIIAPGIFGLGIAYPQAKFDPLGNKEYLVGLWKFMNYLNQVMPIWIKYGE